MINTDNKNNNNGKGAVTCRPLIVRVVFALVEMFGVIKIPIGAPIIRLTVFMVA